MVGFFVKVISDGVFIENIATTSAEATQYRTTLSRKLYYMGSDQALLHQQVLTGQTRGAYQDASGGGNYGIYDGGGTYDDLGFGSFASFFRNYKYVPTSEELMVYTNPNNASTNQGNEYVGQYRFDDTTDAEWRGELGFHTAGSYFNTQVGLGNANVTPLKSADHSGFNDNERYGIFNNAGEQEKGNVWFIDGGPYTGTRWNPNTTLHWAQQSSGNGTGTGVSIGNGSSSMLIAMGGIYTDTADTTSGSIFNIGGDNNTFYNSQKFKDLVGKISPSVKFRFKEDPTGEIYTIKPSGVSYNNRLRWSDGAKMSTSSGEYPAYGGTPIKHYAPQLSPNMTRGYNTTFTNDRTDDGEFNWDPTNGGATGPIDDGLKLTTTRSTAVPLSGTVMLTVAVTDIHDLTCSVNGGKYSITKGMILTSYGGTTLDGTFTDPEGNAASSGFSHEPLIVQNVTGTGPYLVNLTGYSSPILGSDLSGTNLLKHKVFDTAPAAGESMVFQQPAMNGYSQYSVNRINAQDANGDGSSLANPALLAVGYTIEFLEEIETESEFPDNPAIWETEPKDSTDLDIYYEASGYNPLTLTEETVNFVLPVGSGVTHVQKSGNKFRDE